MKKIVQIAFLSSLWMLSISCSSIYRLTVETQEPAEVTFPASVRNLLVVNNAVPQPAYAGYELVKDGSIVNKAPDFQMDSALWICSRNLAKTIRDAKFFKEVLFAEFPLREDEEWLKMKALPKNLRDSLYADSESDAILSVDRILFKTSQMVFKNASGFFIDPPLVLVQIKMDVKLYCSVYLKGKDAPLTSFSVLDSLAFRDPVDMDSVTLYKYLPEHMFRTGALLISESMAPYFTPGWNVADRLIYTSQQGTMKEALSFFKKKKWSSAISIWQTQLAEKKKSKDKARLANNIAVAYEMQDQLDKALEWATKSQGFYKENLTTSDEKETELIEQYINVLNKRIINNKLLNVQLGVESK